MAYIGDTFTRRPGALPTRIGPTPVQSPASTPVPTFGSSGVKNTAAIPANSPAAAAAGVPGQQSTQASTTPYGQGAYNVGLPGAGYVNFEAGSPVNRYETKQTTVSQAPTNVWRGGQWLIPDALDSYIRSINQIGGAPINLSNLEQNTNFQGANELMRFLMPGGGIDYFGRLGIAEGQNNILQQQAAANRALQANLGRNAGNQSLINVLQNQNAFRSQLAMQPLFTEAQRGSYERAAGNIGLNNQQIAAQNAANALVNQVNNQNQLNSLQARLSALQPRQNLLEALNAFQSQARGLESDEGVFAGKNFS